MVSTRDEKRILSATPEKPSAPEQPSQKESPVPTAKSLRRQARARADQAAREARANGYEPVSKSALKRQFMQELEPQIALLRQQEAERRRQNPQSSHPANHRPVRHVFAPVAVASAAEPSAPNPRRLRRDERRSKAEARKHAELTTPAECLTAARGELERGQESAAVPLVLKAVDGLSGAAPERLLAADLMHQAGRPVRAAEIVAPLLNDERQFEPALAMLATMQLAEGDSRKALDLLEKGDRPALAPLKAAAQLSLALHTDDAKLGQQALAGLDKASFSHRNGVLTVGLKAYPDMPEQVRLAAGKLPYVNRLGEGLVAGNRLHEAVQLYDTLSPDQPTCADERREFIRALKSCGKAYLDYGVASREALAELSIPPAPAIAWSQRMEREGMAQAANASLNKAFQRLYQAFELDGTDPTLRRNLTDVIKLTGNPDQVAKVRQRVHRRQKTADAFRQLSGSGEQLAALQQRQEQEVLSPGDTRLLKELTRARAQEMEEARQREALMALITTPRKESDKPAHMPTARARRFYQGPQR